MNLSLFDILETKFVFGGNAIKKELKEQSIIQSVTTGPYQLDSSEYLQILSGL